MCDCVEGGTVQTHAQHACVACAQPTPPALHGPEEDSEVSRGSHAVHMARAMHAATAAGSPRMPSDASVATLLSQILSGASQALPVMEQSSPASTQMHASHAHVNLPRMHAMHVPSNQSPQARPVLQASAAEACSGLSPHQQRVVAAARAACISEDIINWAAVAAGAAAAGQRDPPYPRSANVPASLRQWHDTLTQPLSPEDTLALIEMQAYCRGAK